MRFDGPNGRRNFLLAVIFGFLAVSILVFGIIAVIVNFASPSPKPTTDDQTGTDQTSQQGSGSGSSSEGGSDSDDDGTGVLPGGSDSDKVPATSIKLSSDSVTIATGEKVTIKATLEPENTTDKVTWSSSNNGVATVTEDGVITGVKAGTAYVTAEVNSNVIASVLVTVKESGQNKPPQPPSQSVINPTGIKLDRTSDNVKIGAKIRLKATVIPNNASNTSVTWSSSDASVATVNGGEVTGKKLGAVTITAKTHNGKTATARITVISGSSTTIPATGITVSPTSTSVKVGSTVTISASITPNNATERMITWTSSDNNIATVSSGVVTGKKAGTVTITAKTLSGKTAKATVKVIANPSSSIPATGIKISAKSATIKVGGTYRLTALIEPANATNRVITWSSSNTGIATVVGGVVTGKKAGTVTITAKTHNGKTATAKITVTAK